MKHLITCWKPFHDIPGAKHVHLDKKRIPITTSGVSPLRCAWLTFGELHLFISPLSSQSFSLSACVQVRHDLSLTSSHSGPPSAVIGDTEKNGINIDR